MGGNFSCFSSPVMNMRTCRSRPCTAFVTASSQATGGGLGKRLGLGFRVVSADFFKAHRMRWMMIAIAPRALDHRPLYALTRSNARGAITLCVDEGTSCVCAEHFVPRESSRRTNAPAPAFHTSGIESSTRTNAPAPFLDKQLELLEW